MIKQKLAIIINQTPATEFTRTIKYCDDTIVTYMSLKEFLFNSIG
jgi:hypothetical protein